MQNGHAVLEPRASLEELLNFCNEVREAGGGEQIEELSRARPRDPNGCLIAKGLNFSCQVGGNGLYETGEYRWGMNVPNKPLIASKISQKMHLPLADPTTVIVPVLIGRVAAAYDTWWTGLFAKPGEEFYTDPETAQDSEFWDYLDEDLQQAVIEHKKKLKAQG